MSLRSPLRSLCFLLVVLAVAATLAHVTFRSAVAARALDIGRPEVLRAALEDDPGNGKLRHALGVWYMRSAGPDRTGEAVEELQRAASLSPYESEIWADLAWALERHGDNAGTRRARSALERALELDPMTPQLRWQAANFYLRSGDSGAASAQLRRLLEMDRGYAPHVFSLALRWTGEPAALDPLLMPASQPAAGLRLPLLAFLADPARGAAGLAAASATWRTLAAGSQPFSFSEAQPYIERLVQSGDAAGATQAWTDMLRLGVLQAAPAAAPSSLVFNGEFERDPAGAGLDWRALPQSGVWLDFASSGTASGARCLRADFMGERNLAGDFAAIYVPVVSRGRYRLTAQARTAAIASHSGPRLRVSDPACPSCPPVDTEALTGNTGWRPLEAEFTAGPAQRFARIALSRDRGRSFPTRLNGSYWLDSVALVPVPAPQ